MVLVVVRSLNRFLVGLIKANRLDHVGHLLDGIAVALFQAALNDLVVLVEAGLRIARIRGDESAVGAGLKRRGGSVEMVDAKVADGRATPPAVVVSTVIGAPALPRTVAPSDVWSWPLGERLKEPLRVKVVVPSASRTLKKLLPRMATSNGLPVGCTEPWVKSIVRFMRTAAGLPELV